MKVACRWVWVVSIYFFLSSCGVLKDTATRKQLEEDDLSYSSRDELSAYFLQQKDFRQSGFAQDSANQQYVLRVWPKGSFTISPQLGFQGEADSLLIFGNSASVRKESAAVILSEDSAFTLMKTKAANLAKAQVTKVDSRKHSISSKLVFGVCGVVLLLLLFIKFKNRKIN